MKQYKFTPTLLFLLHLFFPTTGHAAVSYYNEAEYEICDCTNNKFTKHLTEPYKEEIEQWFLQTAPLEDQATEAGTSCIDCSSVSEEEDDDWIDIIANTFSDVWKWIWNDNNDNDDDEKVRLSHHPEEIVKPDFIPSVCFQMSGKMTDENPNSKDDFFSCIHEHYDGSGAHDMCVDTVANDNNSPKKCFAIPVPCEDTKNSSLTCATKFKERDDRNTSSGCNKGSSYPRRPCLNEEYTAMTAKAFHDVAECLNIPPKLAFSILHHESRFLLNNESNTGALCYAQVTGNAIADFNSFLDNKPNYRSMTDLLPENIQERCPEKWKHFKKVNTRYNERRKRFEIKSDQDRCKLNLNPYTCFFYGLSYIKILMHTVENIVQKTNKIETAKRNGRTLIFWGEEEKRRTERRIGEELQTEEIKIFFDEKHLKDILTTIGYNGGPSVPVPVFRDFMTYLKKTLADRRNTELRSNLLQGGLRIDFFINNFTEFLKRNYPSRRKSRRMEVSNYLNKVNGDLNHLHENIHSKYPGSFPRDICPR